jgi:hypothetical protein
MSNPSKVTRHVIARENNVVRVDFTRKPDPPAPRFPGAVGLRQARGIAAAIATEIIGADARLIRQSA